MRYPVTRIGRQNASTEDRHLKIIERSGWQRPRIPCAKPQQYLALPLLAAFSSRIPQAVLLEHIASITPALATSYISGQAWLLYYYIPFHPSAGPHYPRQSGYC